MKMPIPLHALTAALILSGCAQTQGVTRANVDPISLAIAPPGAAPGTCWSKTVTPAVVETVTRKVLLQPAQISSDGRVQVPPLYKSETRQDVVTPRRESWSEILCEADLTPEFIASLQRALAARDYYRGPVTGTLDSRTTTALRRYQKDEGTAKKGRASGAVSIATARTLGLVVTQLPDTA